MNYHVLGKSDQSAIFRTVGISDFRAHLMEDRKRFSSRSGLIDSTFLQTSQTECCQLLIHSISRLINFLIVEIFADFPSDPSSTISIGNPRHTLAEVTGLHAVSCCHVSGLAAG